MKYRIRRKKKPLKSTYILLVVIIILFFISTSYSLFNKTLYINGTVTGDYTEPTLPGSEVVQDGDRLSTNTSLSGGLFNVNVFTHVEDVIEGNNTVVTKIKNGNKTWITSQISVDFSMSIKNNSNMQYTDGKVEVEEYDPGSTITPNTSTLTMTTVPAGETVTLNCNVTFRANTNTTVGSYINYKISFVCNGVTKYFNYKVLVSA